jgi:hypothetical protein
MTAVTPKHLPCHCVRTRVRGARQGGGVPPSRVVAPDRVITVQISFLFLVTISRVHEGSQISLKSAPQPHTSDFPQASGGRPFIASELEIEAISIARAFPLHQLPPTDCSLRHRPQGLPRADVGRVPPPPVCPPEALSSVTLPQPCLTIEALADHRATTAFSGGRLCCSTVRQSCYPTTAKTGHSPGTPFSDWAPFSMNLSPEPTTKSLTVLDTRISFAAALLEMRDAT